MIFGGYAKRKQKDDADKPVSSADGLAPGAQFAIPSPGGPNTGDDPETVRRTLQAIRKALGTEGDYIEVPCAALLSALPDELKGPAWDAGRMPDATLDMKLTDILGQLKKGRITLPLRDVAWSIPEGWIAEAPPETPVDLDVAQVVAAIPEKYFQSAARPAEALLEVDHSKSYFFERKAEDETRAAAPEPSAAPAATPAPPAPAKPGAAAAPAPEVEPTVPVAAAAATAAAQAPVPPAEPPAVAAAPAPAPEAPPAPPKPVVDLVAEWAGVANVFEGGPNVVDLNAASADELQALPAVGPNRAATIVADREKNGPFADTFALGRLTGVIGKKLFYRLTGLSLTRRQPRQDAFLSMLGLFPGATPSLNELVERAAQTLAVSAAAIATCRGELLGFALTDRQSAQVYANLALLFLQRPRKALRALSGSDVDCVILSSSLPQLVLLRAETTCAVFAMQPEVDPDPAFVQRAVDVTREFGWLLRRRAVARPAAPQAQAEPPAGA